ncbi:hypothetical protein ACS0PU_007620 [Formica fusca]
METLSKSCRLAGLPARHEQRSYSSLSRSQQRTIGAYGSRTAGTGSGIIADSMEGSGNSVEDSQKQSMNNPEKLPESTRMNSVRKEHKETRNNNNLRPLYNEHHKSQESKRSKDRSIRKNQDASWTKRTIYKSVHVSNTGGSGKKWSRFLKWLPGFKVFKFSRGSTVPEDCVFDETGNPREELPMTMWNIRDNNEQRPV